MVCPTCKVLLQPGQLGQTPLSRCPKCAACAASTDGLWEHSGGRFEKLWVLARDSKEPGVLCPSCLHKMRRVVAPGEPTIDICRDCRLAWFDPGELEALEAGAPEPERLDKVVGEGEATDFQKSMTLEEAFQPVRRALARIGIPAEDGVPFRGRLPLLTWALALFLAAICVQGNAFLRKAHEQFGVDPQAPLVDAFLRWNLSFLFPAHWAYGAAAIILILVFMDNVEDRLGAPFTALLLAAAHFSAVAVAALAVGVVPGPHGLVMGPAAAVGAVMSYYALSFPLATVSMGVWGVRRWLGAATVRFIWVPAPAAALIFVGGLAIAEYLLGGSPWLPAVGAVTGALAWLVSKFASKLT